MLDRVRLETHRVDVRAKHRSSLPRPGAAVVISLCVLAVVAATSALAADGWPARDYLQGDFFQYWSGAHALLAGSDPYDLSWGTRFSAASGSRAVFAYPEPAVGPTWTTAYPLWTLIGFVPFALMPFALASAAWLVAQLIAVGLGLAALVRTVLRTAPRRDAVVLVGIALAFQPLWLLPGNGNVTGFIFAALAGSLALAARPLIAGALLGALAFKPQSVLLVAITSLIGAAPRARIQMLAGGATVVALLVAVSVVVRPGWPGGWLRSVAALQGSTGSNATFWTLGRAAGVPALSVVVPVAVLLVLVAWALLRRPQPLVLVAASIPVSIGLSPHGWTYDQLHLLITFAVGVELLADASARVRASGIVGLVVVGVVLPWSLYAYGLAHNTEDWSGVVPIFALAWLLVVDGRRSRAPAVVTRPLSTPRPSEI